MLGMSVTVPSATACWWMARPAILLVRITVSLLVYSHLMLLASPSGLIAVLLESQLLAAAAIVASLMLLPSAVVKTLVARL